MKCVQNRAAGAQQTSRSGAWAAFLGQVQDQDNAAWEVFLRQYLWPWRDRFARRKRLSKPDADDLGQEVARRLARYLPWLQLHPGALVPLLNRIGTNLLIDASRRRARRRCVPQDTAQLISPRHDPLGTLEQADLVAHLNRHLAALPEALRSVLKLRYQDGLRGRALAQRLGVSLATVYANLHKGLTLLRKALCDAQRTSNLRG